MKEKDNFQIGDVLYCVDSIKLNVTKLHVVEVDPKANKVVLEEEGGTKRISIQIQTTKFPIEDGQFLYFETFDDAQKHVHVQLRM